MKIILFRILLGIIVVGVVYDRLTRRFVTFSSCDMLIGKPGCGKSTIYAQIATDYLRRGHHVYGTEPVKVYFRDKKTHKKVVLEVKEIEVDKLYRYQFPPYSVILIDEAGVIFHNRNFKNFDKRNVAFFKRYRHDNLKIFLFSQSFDIDLVIRNLVSQFWIVEKYLRVIAVRRRLIMKPVVVHPTGDAPSSIQDDFVEDPKLLRPVLGGMKFCWIPHWVNMFNSFEIPEYQLKERDIDLSEDPIPYEQRKVYHRHLDKLTTYVVARWNLLRRRYAEFATRIRVILSVRGIRSSHSKR